MYLPPELKPSESTTRRGESRRPGKGPPLLGARPFLDDAGAELAVEACSLALLRGLSWLSMLAAADRRRLLKLKRQ
jgi:hypothetical protein